MDPEGKKKKILARRTMKKKRRALKRMEKGENWDTIARELGVTRRQMCQWLCNKITRLYESEQTDGIGRKNLSQVQTQQFDEVLYLWYVKCIKQGIPVTGPMIRGKSLELNGKLRPGCAFQASDCWLQNWRKRRGIINPEQRFANEDPCAIFDGKFKTVIKEENLTADQVFITSQAFLCHKLLPSKNFELEQFSNEKHDRLSIVTCCNATGSLKLPLMVIGKPDEKLDESQPSPEMNLITYKSQKFSWLDNKIFRDWFLDEFVPTVSNFLEENALSQKAVLILDDNNVLLDENIFQVGAIKTMYLPTKVTSLICLDEGVLENIKKRYRYQFLTSLYFALEGGKTVAEYVNNITMNEILYWLASSWNEITPFTISSLWKNNWTEMQDNKKSDETESDPPPSSEFLAILKRIPEFANMDKDDLQDWFNCDRIMPNIPDENFIIEAQKMFCLNSDSRGEMREATNDSHNEEVPGRCENNIEDQNISGDNGLADANNYPESFNIKSENTSNNLSLLTKQVNCDSNAMSSASNMVYDLSSDSSIEQPSKRRKKAESPSKESENETSNEFLDANKQKSDESNEVDAFCKRLAASLKRLSPKTRSRVEIDLLKILYEAEFGEKI